MYNEPTYGGAPARPLPRMGLAGGYWGARPPAGSPTPSPWTLARAQGPTTTQHLSDGGVIISPLVEAATAHAMDLVDTAVQRHREEVAYATPTPEPEAQPEPQASYWPDVELTSSPGPSSPTLIPVGGGGGAPVNVSVTAPEGSAMLIPEDKPGFGMMEAALGAAVAFLLAQAWQRGKR